MSNLKQLKLRIAGVKSTQKITKAMKMVAAAKLLRAQEKKDKAKVYANKLTGLVNNVAMPMIAESVGVSLLLASNNNTHLLVVISADRGLCGSFNSALAKKVRHIIKDLTLRSLDYRILCIGKKAYENLKPLYQTKIIETIPSFSNKKFYYSDAVEIKEKLIELYNKGEFGYCTVIYNEFQNAVKQNVVQKQIIPFISRELIAEQKVFEYEPREEKILDKLLPENIAVQLYYMILESIASEHGARMTAMDSATNNATDMIASLTLKYNRSRQAAITKELIEIVSSAEAL